jgi:amidohydrolase
MKKPQILRGAFLAVTLLTGHLLFGQTADKNAPLKSKMDKMAMEMEAKVIAWRRDLHQNPELSNRETRTAEKVAEHLRSLKFDEVKTGVAKTGVIGILKGGKPGPTVALRADMDALPVTERGDLPFKSLVKTTYNNQATGVMHACGHDTHVAILMGTAEIMAKMRSELAGTFVFIFQPSEEGAPIGELGGAGEMIKEGALDNPKVETIFGLHVNSQTEVGTLRFRSGGTMASSDRFVITIKNKRMARTRGTALTRLSQVRKSSWVCRQL